MVVEVKLAQLCPTFCDPIDGSLPGSSIRGILQSRILEWVAMSFSRRSSQPRDQTSVSRIAGRRFTIWATRETQNGSGGAGQIHILIGHIKVLFLCKKQQENQWWMLSKWIKIDQINNFYTSQWENEYTKNTNPPKMGKINRNFHRSQKSH